MNSSGERDFEIHPDKHASLVAVEPPSLFGSGGFAFLGMRKSGPIPAVLFTPAKEPKKFGIVLGTSSAEKKPTRDSSIYPNQDAVISASGLGAVDFTYEKDSP